MPDHFAAYFDAKGRASAAGDVVKAMVAKISAAGPVLERWQATHVPHDPRRMRAPENPLKGLENWPSWEAASEAVGQYLGCVREMDQAFAGMTDMERREAVGPPLPARL